MRKNQTESDFLRRLRKSMSRLEGKVDNGILGYCDAVALECLEEINTDVRRGWRDRTGNLFSSIGLTTGVNGKVLRHYGFGGTGNDGMRAGREMAEELTRKERSCISIVAVAAMPYAEDMEARGIAVLASVERIMATRMTASALERQLRQKVKDEK